jgi:hypothetical protein
MDRTSCQDTVLSQTHHIANRDKFTFLADGRLRRVTGTPEFSHSAYAVYATGRNGTAINRVLGGLRTIAAGREPPRLAGIIGSHPPMVS